MNQPQKMENENLAELQNENEVLSQQVQRLIKAEAKLYDYQERLDIQLKEYQTLHELNKKINSCFDIREAFGHAAEYVIRNLEYERVIFFQRDEETADFTVCALDGYYDEQERQEVIERHIDNQDPMLLTLMESREKLICTGDSSAYPEYHTRLHMLEFLVYPLGNAKRLSALVVLGNSAENAEYYRRVSDVAEDLMGAGNFVGLLSSRVENFRYYANMEKALEQERQAEIKFRGIFENSTEGIIQVRDKSLISCNPAAATILGYDSPEEAIAAIDDIERIYVEPERRKEIYQILQHGEMVRNFEVQFFRKDGSLRWVQLNTRPILDEQGNISYVDGMIQDIDDRKRAEHQLQALNEELEERVAARTSELEQANLDQKKLTRELEAAFQELKSAQSKVLQQEKMASIGQLAAGVAHEINNPMGFIISNLNTFRKYTEKIAEFIEQQSGVMETLSDHAEIQDRIIELKQLRKRLQLDFIIDDLNDLLDESLEGADRVKTIVQNLKSFSRMDESEFKLADINAGLDSTIKMVWNEIKYKAECIKDFSELPETYCNLGQLNQVFMNLLVNSAHAIEQNGEIRVSTSLCGDKILISIMDNGCGIPEEVRSRIFEPFFTTKAVGKGTGLGLSIVYDIVKSHQGDIQVDSQVGEGTTFTISLPVTAAPQDAV